MTDVTVPIDAGEKQARKLLREHLEVGEEVLVRNQETAAGDRIEERGEVTGFEPAYLELDGQPLTGKSISYEQVHIVTKLEAD